MIEILDELSRESSIVASSAIEKFGWSATDRIFNWSNSLKNFIQLSWSTVNGEEFVEFCTQSNKEVHLPNRAMMCLIFLLAKLV